MIQHVESLRAELQFEPFNAQRERLHHGWIHMHPRSRSEAVSLYISIRAGRVDLERRGVEFSVQIGRRVSGVPVRTVKAKSGLRIVSRIGDAEWLSCISHHQAAHSPCTSNRT